VICLACRHPKPYVTLRPYSFTDPSSSTSHPAQSCISAFGANMINGELRKVIQPNTTYWSIQTQEPSTSITMYSLSTTIHQLTQITRVMLCEQAHIRNLMLNSSTRNSSLSFTTTSSLFSTNKLLNIESRLKVLWLVLCSICRHLLLLCLCATSKLITGNNRLTLRKMCCTRLTYG